MSDRPGTLSPADRRVRNRQIAEARHAGTSWREIARRFEVSERQARRAAADALQLSVEEHGLTGLDPEAILGRIIRIQLRALDRVAVLMEGADNSSAEVGAARAAGSIGADLRASLIGAGLIPDSGERLRLKRETRAAAFALHRIARRLGATDEEFDAELSREPQLMRTAAVEVG